jgi:hypothetical protein
MSNGVYGKGMQLEDSDGNLYKVDEYTSKRVQFYPVKWDKKYTLVNIRKKMKGEVRFLRTVDESEILEEFSIVGIPYKVEQKIQDAQGNIYSIKRAYLAGPHKYYTFDLDKRLGDSKIINIIKLRKEKYLFSVRVRDLELNEKYKFDNYENMELVYKEFDEDNQIYNLKFYNAEMKDEVLIEVKDNPENKYRFYQYHRETWRNVEEVQENDEENKVTGGKKTRRKKLTRKRKKSSKKLTRKRKMSSKVLRGH